MARSGLRHLEDGDAASIRVSEEAGELVQERELPVHRVPPLTPVHHDQGGGKLVVEGPGHLLHIIIIIIITIITIINHHHHHHLVLSDCHDEGVLLGLSAAVGGDHVEVVDADVLLQGQGEDLLGPRHEGGPVQVVNLRARVPAVKI